MQSYLRLHAPFDTDYSQVQRLVSLFTFDQLKVKLFTFDQLKVKLFTFDQMKVKLFTFDQLKLLVLAPLPL